MNHNISSIEGLNNLQSGIHRQYMKDLFVELCLTVPVRLRLVGVILLLLLVSKQCGVKIGCICKWCNL